MSSWVFKTYGRQGRGLFSLYIYMENMKNLLERNHWTDLNITWQKCSFGNPLPRWINQCWFVKKKWLPGGGAYFPCISIKKTLKIFLSETTGPISILHGRNVPLVNLYQDCLSRHDMFKNMAARGRSLFSLYIFIENLKMFSSPDRFQYNLAGMLLWWLSTNIIQAVLIGQKTMARGRGLFSLYIYRKLLKKIPIRNHLTNFNITWQGNLRWPSTKNFLGGSVGCASDWRPGGLRFDPRQGWQHSLIEIDHEIFSTVILSLPLIQEGQLSVSGERKCTILVNHLED